MVTKQVRSRILVYGPTKATHLNSFWGQTATRPSKSAVLGPDLVDLAAAIARALHRWCRRCPSAWSVRQAPRSRGTSLRKAESARRPPELSVGLCESICRRAICGCRSSPELSGTSKTVWDTEEGCTRIPRKGNHGLNIARPKGYSKRKPRHPLC